MSISSNPARPYKNLKTVFIKSPGVAGKYGFSKFINVPFDVDELVVQSVSAFNHDCTVNWVSPIGEHILISSNILPEEKDLVVLYPEESQARITHSRFAMKQQPVIGNFNFLYTLLDGSEVIEPITFKVSVVVELLFIQY